VGDVAAGADGAARAREITSRLRAAYGVHGPGGDQHPTDSLIGTILSQHTSDINSGRAFIELKRRFPTWEDVASADERDLAQTIKSAGLGNIKARRIQAALAEIERRFGTMDLDALRDLSLPEARDALRGVPGVGPKTAACVLLFACGLPALPVDTHVHRVAGRLGLIGPRTTANRAHDELEAIVATEDVYDFHVDLIAHGRRVCIARSPRCGECVLQDLCTYFREHIAPIQE
jgi:endonuclease-3